MQCPLDIIDEYHPQEINTIDNQTLVNINPLTNPHSIVVLAMDESRPTNLCSFVYDLPHNMSGPSASSNAQGSNSSIPSVAIH